MDSKNRDPSLDLFRGLAVLLMVFANALAVYTNVPMFLKHAPYDGFTLPDIVMPLFLFAIGFSMELSFRSRLKKNGAVKTILHSVVRNVLLMAFGFLGTFLVPEYGWWGVLEALGLTGILTIPFLFQKPFLRFVIAFAVLILYQAAVFLFSPQVIGIFMITGLGGPFGSLSWLFLTVTGTGLAAWLRDKNYPSRITLLSLAGIVLIVSGIIANVFFPFNKHLVSSSYVLLSSGICAYLYMLLTALTEQFRVRVWPVEIMGKNALFLYMFSAVLGIGENFLISPGPGANLWLVIVGFFSVAVFTWLAAWVLDLRKIIIKL